MKNSLARVYSAELEGITAKLIEIEVDLNVGLHSFQIVGLADKALSESKERVNSALKNAGAKPPNRENRKITVSLAPADIQKTGSQYDLGIAIGYLLSTQQIKNFNSEKILFLGELALDGRVRGINGTLNIVELAKENKFEKVFLPAINTNEASVVQGITLVPIESLSHAIDVLESRVPFPEYKKILPDFRINDINTTDLSEIKGQLNAKRALTIAAAGGHNLLMVGPPGVGKSLLAQALIGILPALSLEEAIEVTKIYSAAGIGLNGLLQHRPFRAPHHTASVVSVVGGGSNPKPGEISLAHRGILFLDELPEFPKSLLESLRQPLENGTIHVARAKGSIIFPARFSLIAAMNPCPCGFYGDTEKECQCSAHEVVRYQKKISGPLLDRIDLQIRVQRVDLETLHAERPLRSESTDARKEIESARNIQRARFKNLSTKTNAEMSSKLVEDMITLSDESEKFLKTLARKNLSPRGYYRLLKTGRTIADLENSSEVTANHLAEAFSYRLQEED